MNELSVMNWTGAAERLRTLAERFECKDHDWLSVDSTLTFTGMDISEVAEAGGTVYRMDQTRDLEYMPPTSS